MSAQKYFIFHSTVAMTITIKWKRKGTLFEVQSWGYVKWRNNQVSSQEPLIEWSAFQGKEKNMCVGIPSFPIVVILGQVFNVCYIGFGWRKCLHEQFTSSQISLGGTKDLYLQIMHFLWSAFVWAWYTLANDRFFVLPWWEEQSFICRMPGLQPDVLLFWVQDTAQVL